MRISVAHAVDRSGPMFDDVASSAHDRCCDYREEDLERLEVLLHDDASESLRTRWAEELALVHAEHLAHADQSGAEDLRRRLHRELERSSASLERPHGLRQHRAGARVCVDWLRQLVESGRLDHAIDELPQTLVRSFAASKAPDGPGVLAEALELAHHLELHRGDEDGARAHLELLQRLTHAGGGRSTHEPLARALTTAVRHALEHDRPRLAHRHLAQLRAQARRVSAHERERTFFATALLAVHEAADGPQQRELELELEALANRPGAHQEQRNAWARAVGRAERTGRRVLRRPLELLRERAYRGTDVEDLGALFDRLEQELPAHEGHFYDLLGALNEMRSIAERPEVDPSLRLRFARRWLEQGYDARRYDHGAVANDRCAHDWATQAAARGDLEGHVLRGRCLAFGRGVPRDRAAAAEVLRQAATRGSDEAELLVRTLGFERFPWMRHRYPALRVIGLLMLVATLVLRPWHFDPWGILAYFAVGAAALLVTSLLQLVAARLSGSTTDDSEPDGSGYLVDMLVRRFERRPWQILVVATEDGFALAPLLWLGITPVSAIAAGLVFGLAHYPAYSLRSCLHKAFDYTLVALLVLPWAGLWPVVVGHVLWDVILLGSVRTLSRRAEATARRP